MYLGYLQKHYMDCGFSPGDLQHYLQETNWINNIKQEFVIDE